MIGLLADESANVRQRCLQTVARLKLKEAGPALRTMYAEARGRAAALEILDCIGRIGDPGQADLLRELVRGADGEKKRLAIEGLGRVSDPAMLAAFKKDYQTEGNEELRLAYCFALSYLGDSAFLHSIVLSLGSSTLGPRCRDYLLELGPKIAPDLYEYLSDPDAAVRAELCDILAAMGDLAALPRLGEMINDPSARVAKRANSAIVRLRQIQAARQ